MKKYYKLLLTSILITSACTNNPISNNNSSSSENNDTSYKVVTRLNDDILKNVQKGYQMEGYMSINYIDTSDVPALEGMCYRSKMIISSNDDYYTVKQYNGSYVEANSNTEPNSNVLSRSRCYTHIKENNKNLLNSYYINLGNKVDNSIIYNSSTNEPYTWESSAFYNFFNGLNASDFERFEDENSFILKTNNNEKYYNYLGIARQAYGGWGLSLNYFIVYTNGKDITNVKIRLTPPAGEKSYLTFDYKVVLAGDNSLLLPQTFETTNAIDETFDNKINKLKNYNYKVKTILSSSSDQQTYEAWTSNKDSLYYKKYDKDNNLFFSGGEYLEDNKIQEVVSINSKNYVNGEASDYNIGYDFRPTFNLSSVFFKKNGNEYDLDTTYLNQPFLENFTTLHFSPLARNTSPSSISLTNLKVKIDNENITFITSFNYVYNALFSEKYDLSITYYDIGKVNDSINVSEVIKDTSSLSIKDLFSNYTNKYETIKSKIPESELDNYVLYGDIYSDYDVTKLESSVLLTLNNQKDYNENSKMATIYEEKLIKNGFNKSSISGPNGINRYYVKENNNKKYGIEIGYNKNTLLFYLSYEEAL